MVQFPQATRSLNADQNASSSATRESIGCDHPRFWAAVQRVTCRRRASWCRLITQQEAECTLAADFIARDGLLFLAESASQAPQQFTERLHRRLDNHARHLFRADFNDNRHRTVRGEVLDFTGFDLSQLVDRRSNAIDPSEAAEREDISVFVRKAMMETLRPVELEVIKSRMMHGRSLRETASSLDLTESQVRRIQTTAVMKLRIALDSYRFTATEHSALVSSNSPNGVAQRTVSCAIT